MEITAIKYDVLGKIRVELTNGTHVLIREPQDVILVDAPFEAACKWINERYGWLL